jgi:ABC-type antimicrobial peptide transport system permease subunit
VVAPSLSASPPAGGVAAACLGIIALAAGLGALVARRAARAPVAEALRAE